MNSLDTQPIAALASGHGAGAIAVIRVSGEGTFNLLNQCLSSPVSSKPLRTAFLSSFVDSNRTVIDELVVLAFKGPASFTGQDTVELMCHGGPYIIQTILERLYELGIRAAEPGEFTKRAFLNNKLDLTAAEGIRDLVEAQSKQQWLAGRQLVSGQLAAEVSRLRREMIEAMAYLEAMIDFPDEGDTTHVNYDHVRSRVEKVDASLKQLAASYQSGHVASQGLQVALYGPPNAGKSTLMNELLGKQRAIVSSIAGTTRDYIEERCLMNGRLIRLVDMAGIRETHDEIEAEGVYRANSIAAESDIVLVLVPSDVDQRTAEEIIAKANLLASQNQILVIQTKSDIPATHTTKVDIKISCANRVGIKELENLLAGLVDQRLGSITDKPFITSARQKAAVQAATDSLKKFWQSISAGYPQELVAFELQQAANALKEVTGSISTEDILDKVFSEFCIGK